MSDPVVFISVNYSNRTIIVFIFYSNSLSNFLVLDILLFYSELLMKSINLYILQ